MKKMWSDDELIKFLEEHREELTPDKLIKILMAGENITLTIVSSPTGAKLKISSSGGEITPQILFDLIKGSDSIVVDLSEDEEYLEIHLDGDILAKLDRALLLPLSVSEFKLIGVDNEANKKMRKNAPTQQLIGLDSSLKIDNGKLCSLIPSGNNLPSGRFSGELFILNVDVETTTKGIYKYNGSLWEKVADIGGGDIHLYHHQITVQIAFNYSSKLVAYNCSLEIINNSPDEIKSDAQLYLYGPRRFQNVYSNTSGQPSLISPEADFDRKATEGQIVIYFRGYDIETKQLIVYSTDSEITAHTYPTDRVYQII